MLNKSGGENLLPVGMNVALEANSRVDGREDWLTNLPDVITPRKPSRVATYSAKDAGSLKDGALIGTVTSPTGARERALHE